MRIPDKVLELIREEQERKSGNFIPNKGYLDKLAENAELLSYETFSECLGFVFFYCNDVSKYSSYITLIMVSPHSRRSGMGAALVKYVLMLTKQRGFKVCRLEVQKENAAAISLYRSIGFVQFEDHGDKYLLEARVI